ncbi:copper chaperone PCu(A)C [Rhabdothermincola sediminis]|uniref:copper chaperone PCu(A)C n=1 Tax=Rhabdothermincola sediminis TaxID=2751370 RepID=UPI001AA04D3C|nr:copper chaperone PCu(A)C [Rhabdothermincola sediminis]
MTSIRLPLAAAGLALAAASFVTGCGKDETGTTAATTTTAAIAAPPVVSDAWCRTSPMVADAGACYLVISNSSSEAARLVGASVPPSIAGKAELHETVQVGGMEGSGTTTGAGMGSSSPGGTMAGNMPDTTMSGGMMQMREVDAIEVPAGGTVELKPGGYHVMLLELAEPLTEGTMVPLTLRFEGFDPVVVEAEVRSG